MYNARKKNRRPFFLIFLLGLGAYYFYVYYCESPSSQAVMMENNQRALKNCTLILKALESWKKNNYDANHSEKDYPVNRLCILHDTQLVNGDLIELISPELAKADLRDENATPYEGYYYTLTDMYQVWPWTGMSLEVTLLATPADFGKTGSCVFFANTRGEAYLSNVDLFSATANWHKTAVFATIFPQWPSWESLEYNIWGPLELPSGTAPK